MDAKQKFETKLHEMLSLKKASNSKLFTQQQLDETIANVQRIDNSEKKVSNERRLLKQKAVIHRADGSPCLVDRDTNRSYVPTEELFDLLAKLHLETGHGGRDIMEVEAKRKNYANVTRDIIKIYITECEECALKRPMRKKGLITNPIVSNDFNSRGQVDLIDWQSEADGDYKWILNYQDNLTKFSVLRACKTKQTKEVSIHLFEIFCLIGAPHVLQVTYIVCKCTKLLKMHMKIDYYLSQIMGVSLRAMLSQSWLACFPEQKLCMENRDTHSRKAPWSDAGMSADPAGMMPECSMSDVELTLVDAERLLCFATASVMSI